MLHAEGTDTLTEIRRRIALLDDHDPEKRTRAVLALGRFAYNNPRNQDAIREAGGIAPLIRLLGDEKAEVRRYAVMALINLIDNNSTNCDVIRPGVLAAYSAREGERGVGAMGLTEAEVLPESTGETPRPGR